MSINLQELLALTSHLRILYVEDDTVLRENTVLFLQDLFSTIDEASDGIEALEHYETHLNHYDIVITDLNMPNMSGMELVRHIHRINPKQPVIVISAHNETEFFLESIRNNVVGYILKPIDFDQLIETLYKTAIHIKKQTEEKNHQHFLEQKLQEQHQTLEKHSEVMNEFLTLDSITKLENASMLSSFLQTLEEGHAVTIMLYNIDNFSFINQKYGVEFADETLRKVGEFLQFSLLANARIYRYNSDEFVIIFDPHLSDPESIAIQTQALFRETPVGEVENQSVYITLSCGIATSKNPASLLPNARMALREARMKNLPNQYTIYNAPELFEQPSFKDNEWTQKFRLALEEDRLIPFFQPIVDATSQQIVSYECLARIEEDGQFITPFHFLEAARHSGLMSNLTRVMIHKAFKLFSNNNACFSINISNEDLLTQDFINFLIHKQKSTPIDPHRITFEILEDIIISDANHVPLQNLHILKAMGYRLALDDFGSDRSNFNRLESIGVDTLKIDGQFIKNIYQTQRNQDIVESITAMAHKLNIKVVAEFVSTQEEFELLKELGVDYMQGHFFSDPLHTL